MCKGLCESKDSEGTGGVDMCDSLCESVGDAAGAHRGRGDAVGEGAYELVDEPVSRKDAYCMTRSVIRTGHLL